MPDRSQYYSQSSQKEIAPTIRGIDLFCGAGGLTRGLETAGIDISLGIDIDPACEFPYQANNSASFHLKAIEDLTATDFPATFSKAPFKLIAGCAPCQPFSTYSQNRSSSSDSQWNLLGHFARIVKESKPHFVTMENVPRLKSEHVFFDFTKTLESEGFKVSYAIVNCANYGVPQQRKRLVLLASRLGSIDMIEPTSTKETHITVERAIGNLPRLNDGEICKVDPLHQASKLSLLNLKRIRASKPGGTWRDWDEELKAKCHKRASGKNYASVYGRMTWEDPSPTITTQFYGYGNGRFGHPEQDRALSLREGAILQSFANDYLFVPEGEPIHRKVIGRLIGNAVPVRLGTAIGISIVRHVETWLESKRRSSQSLPLHSAASVLV